MCTAAAHAVFELDETGTLVVLIEEVPDDHVEAVRDAVDCCPTEALALE